MRIWYKSLFLTAMPMDWMWECFPWLLFLHFHCNCENVNIYIKSRDGLLVGLYWVIGEMLHIMNDLLDTQLVVSYCGNCCSFKCDGSFDMGILGFTKSLKEVITGNL